MLQREYDGQRFKIGKVLRRADAYTRYLVTYESAGLTISGIMNVPVGAGPFPLLILAHGHIDTDIYVNGQGLAREQDYLARRGYVVVHTDYRSHAQSTDDPANELRLRLGYTEDVINAILSLKKAALPFVDAERVGVLGRSMGGGVSLNAAIVRPDLIDAVVLYSSVSSNVVDNFNKWIRSGDSPRRSLAQTIMAAYGSPEANPAFWRNVSPRYSLDRIAAPILVHHGTADDTCPIAWSQKTVEALRAANKQVTFFTYPGEGHAFGSAWTTSIRRTTTFFDGLLKP